jgi:hypothetical protein
MISQLAHVTALDSAVLAAVFGLGWVLGSLATARFAKKSTKQ